MNRIRLGIPRLLALLLPALLFVGDARPALAQDDIDAFMERVLERRVTNWEDLYRYTLRDREVIDITGPDGARIESQVGEYIWYVREGYMVRSPYTLNGARVGDNEREEFESRYLERVRVSDEEREANEGLEEGADIEREYFLGFPFEAGNYYLVGYEDFEGQEVAKIEYYPEELFEDEGDDEEDQRWTRRFQKTSRIVLWVLVEEHQILKVAYDNVGLDFLPYRWLVQVDDVRAELIMHKPFEGEDVYLPREILIAGEMTVATGTFSVSYSLEYFDYKETDIGARVRFRLPGVEQQNE
ncbi:MAG: hypothetical protein GKS06_14910 [Acidobacteria bacterium]|nr:hypothetical protein [Acidobacteriota bacterium]